MKAASSILLALVAAMPSAQPSNEVFTVVAACGKPQWISRPPQTRYFEATSQRLHYSSLDLIFQRARVGERWVLSRTSFPGKDDAVSPETALHALPCLKSASARLPLFTAEATAAPAVHTTVPSHPAVPSPAPPSVAAPAETGAEVPAEASTAATTPASHSIVPFIAAGLILAFVVAAGVLVFVLRRRRQSTIPESGWLCTSCYVISEPERDENEELLCSVCGYGTPIPFDSAEAREYFSAKKLNPRSAPQSTREQEV